MSDSPPIPFPTLTGKADPNRFTPWPKEDRELAFELWLGHGRPSLNQLVKIIERDTNKRIPHETLRQWFHNQQWDLEADRKLAALSPNMMVRSALSLTVAGVHASKYLERVWTPGADEPFDRDRHAAALATLAALGFSPGSKARPALPTPNDSDAVDDTDDPATALARITARRQARQG